MLQGGDEAVEGRLGGGVLAAVEFSGAGHRVEAFQDRAARARRVEHCPHSLRRVDVRGGARAQWIWASSSATGAVSLRSTHVVVAGSLLGR